MTYEEWCKKNIAPVVQQYVDGAITIGEMNSCTFARTTKALRNGTMPRPDTSADVSLKD